MTGSKEHNIIRLDAAQAALRQHFLGWQCRLRQHSVRHAGGRPTPGLRPTVSLADQSTPLAQITVLIVEQEPDDSAAQFRHMVLKTHDPAERYEAALRTLSAAYYQQPQRFSDELTALFGPGANLAERLRAAARCVLEFEQYNQRYVLPCTTRALAQDEPAFQATYWHNRLFNPNLPPDISILGFRPNWSTAQAHPPVD